MGHDFAKQKRDIVTIKLSSHNSELAYFLLLFFTLQSNSYVHTIIIQIIHWFLNWFLCNFACCHFHLIYFRSSFFSSFFLGSRNYIHPVSEALPDLQLIPSPNMRKLPALFQWLLLPWSKFSKGRILSDSLFILLVLGIKILNMQNWKGDIKISIGSYHLFPCTP